MCTMTSKESVGGWKNWKKVNPRGLNTEEALKGGFQGGSLKGGLNRGLKGCLKGNSEVY